MNIANRANANTQRMVGRGVERVWVRTGACELDVDGLDTAATAGIGGVAKRGLGFHGGFLLQFFLLACAI